MDLSKLRPVGDRVLIKVDTTAEVTEGGIYIPDNSREPLTRGVIVAVGAGAHGKCAAADALDARARALKERHGGHVDQDVLDEFVESMETAAKRLRRLQVKVGDRVVFGKYAGSDVEGTEQREPYRLLADDDLLAVVED